MAPGAMLVFIVKFPKLSATEDLGEVEFAKGGFEAGASLSARCQTRGSSNAATSLSEMSLGLGGGLCTLVDELFRMI